MFFWIPFRKFVKGYTGNQDGFYFNTYKIIKDIYYFINILVIFYVPFFNAKRRIRANILNIKAKIEDINIVNALFRSGFNRKQKREFILSFLNMFRVNGFNKIIPFIKVKNIFITIYLASIVNIVTNFYFLLI